METQEALMRRRSIRKFTDQRVSREDLEAILQAGIWAPSATNTQPWYFLALTNDQDIDWLLDAQRAHREAQRAKLNKRFADHPETVRETLGFMDTLGGARTLVLSFLRKPDYGEAQTACIESVGAAMENMLIAATGRGIASCWVEDLKRLDAEVRQHFELETGPLLGVIALGYGAYEGRAIKRKPGRFDIR